MREVAALSEPVRGQSARRERAAPSEGRAVRPRSAGNPLPRLQCDDHRAGRSPAGLPDRRCGRVSIAISSGFMCWWKEAMCLPSSSCME